MKPSLKRSLKCGKTKFLVPAKLFRSEKSIHINGISFVEQAVISLQGMVEFGGLK
jgi:hypothetical protein